MTAFKQLRRGDGEGKLKDNRRSPSGMTTKKQRMTTREAKSEAVNYAGSVFRNAVHDRCGRTQKKRPRRLIERWI